MPVFVACGWRAQSWQKGARALRSKGRATPSSVKESDKFLLLNWFGEGDLRAQYVGPRHYRAEGPLRAAVAAPPCARYSQARARRRLRHGRACAAAEEARQLRGADHPQRPLYGVVSAQRAPAQKGLRLRHGQQADLPDVQLWQGQHLPPVHRRVPHQALRVHDAGLQVLWSFTRAALQPWSARGSHAQSLDICQEAYCSICGLPGAIKHAVTAVVPQCGRCRLSDATL
ncbi:hypothetical protein NDU88_006281 [Pleurodeles waltl]|uniref:Uncharacterized protein n=1 Tax=Pleurodeles waltl TaxID=8319 RepID=A0AAV7LQE8_PLEWA|nr:hypothetical protein NDU88_006281 [Pleurodeles waltl]